MGNMLLMIIVAPLKVALPVFLTIFAIVAIILGVSYIALKKEEKSVIEKGNVIFPENLFEDIAEMKKVNNLRLFSKRVEKHLFIITASEISEEYKDGKFVSYNSEKPTEIDAKRTSLKEFIAKVPQINYKSMIKRIGFTTRIDFKEQVIYKK